MMYLSQWAPVHVSASKVKMLLVNHPQFCVKNFSIEQACKIHTSYLDSPYRSNKIARAMMMLWAVLFQHNFDLPKKLF